MNTQVVQGRWDQIRGKVKEKWGQLTDDDLKMVSGNLDQLIGKIQQKTGEARDKVEEFLDELAASDSPLAAAKDKAMEYGQAAMDTAREGYDRASQQMREGYDRASHSMQEGYDRAGRMVRQRPAESMAVIFGLGFITGLGLGMLFSDRS